MNTAYRKNWKPQVGDIVRIRQWDDMLAEYGKNSFGINCACNFTLEMLQYCGSEFTITEIKSFSLGTAKRVFGLEGCSYVISTDMIEPVLNVFDRETWEIHTGDVVRVREWDDMEAQYGIHMGSIPCNLAFTDAMKEICGREFVVKSIDEDEEVYGHGFGFAISKDMLVPAWYHEDSFVDSSEMSDFLGAFTVV